MFHIYYNHQDPTFEPIDGSGGIMKRTLILIVLALLLSCLFALTASAETIYLRDGTIERGVIIKEDDTSIFLEMNGSWKKIDRTAIAFIKTDTVPQEEKPQVTTAPTSTFGEPPAKGGAEHRQGSPAPAQNAASAPTAASTTKDLRIRFGSTTGITELEDDGFVYSLEDDGGGNFQIDFVVGLYRTTTVGLVLSAGLFSREHSGFDNDPFFPTKIEYTAGGISLGAGIGIQVSPKAHVEGRLELGLGSGEPTFTSPGAAWNPVQSGPYASVSLIVGGYITLSTPGLQLGLELGSQSFSGSFEIWNNAGFWDEATVNGSGGMVNAVLGFRF
jgi:hypothetical protein